MIQTASPQRKKMATFLAFMLIPLSGLVTDIYLPSFPSMAKDLGLSEKNIQFTLSCFLLSYGIGQLFIGSLLDSIGRYRASIFSLFILVISCIGIGVSRDFFVICSLRVLQGLSIATIVVAKRAFFVDLYSGEKLKNYLSLFTVAWSCGPVVAPFIGGYLEKYWGWQSNFYFIGAYALLMLLLEWIFSGESLIEKKPFRLKNVANTYQMMLRSGNFILGVFILGLSFSIVMVFSMSGPFIIEHTFHFDAIIIGYCALILGISWMVGGLLGKRLTNWENPYKVLIFCFIQIVLIIMMLISGHFSQTLFSLIAFAFFIHICSGFIFNIYFTNGMMIFPNNAGVAGGLLGGLAYVVTSLFSYGIATSGTVNSQNDIAWRYLILSVLLAIVIMIWMRTKRIYSLSQESRGY